MCAWPFPLLRARGGSRSSRRATVAYRRWLTLGQRFEIATRVVGWEERVVYLEQSFTRDEHLHARGLVAGRFLTRGSGRRVPAPEVVALLGDGVTAPELPDDVARWARALDVAHRT